MMRLNLNALPTWVYLIVLSGNLPAFSQAVAPPVCEDAAKYPEYHTLDGWAGHWSVYWNGKQIADTNIEVPKGGCYISETWASVPPGAETAPRYVSKGLVSYDGETKQWEYFWVSAKTGEHLHFTAEPAKQLVWIRHPPLPSDRAKVQHLTFTKQPDGTLRELAVTSADGGKSWVTDYDLSWHKKP